MDAMSMRRMTPSSGAATSTSSREANMTECIGRSTAERILELNKQHDALMLDGQYEDAANLRERVQEEPLSVLVRTGWFSPGQEHEALPEEYEILLGTGGPAIRIVGELTEFLEPCTARLQWQDWWKPWADVVVSQEEEDAILWYAQQFWFGA
jgi:hypothetical protein